MHIDKQSLFKRIKIQFFGRVLSLLHQQHFLTCCQNVWNSFLHVKRLNVNIRNELLAVSEQIWVFNILKLVFKVTNTSFWFASSYITYLLQIKRHLTNTLEVGALQQCQFTKHIQKLYPSTRVQVTVLQIWTLMYFVKKMVLHIKPKSNSL